MRKIKPILTVLFVIYIVYTRFVNLSWGLPYPMHPDERNMVDALMGLKLDNLLKPDFYAYGQSILYLAYGLLSLYYLFSNKITTISFFDGAVALRFISAIASVATIIVLIKIIRLMFKKEFFSEKKDIIAYPLYLILGLSPFAIQFSHFGTTESVLILLYASVVFLSLRIISETSSSWRMSVMIGIVCGIAIAVKVSSILFILVPLFTFIFQFLRLSKKQYRVHWIQQATIFLLVTVIIALIFSPYNYISFWEFYHSMRYESDVAIGNVLVFYTRQFVRTIPVVFQLTSIFPYALGWPVFFFSFFGFFLHFRKKEMNLLRFAFLVYFIPQSFLFAKWTRFVAPVFPLLLIFSYLFLYSVFSKTLKIVKKNQKIRPVIFTVFILVIFFSILPGIAYLSIYQNKDVRFQASEWIYTHIPSGSLILSETANGVDIPLRSFGYRLISFDFYNMDEDFSLQNALQNYIKKADYIFVPSRRVFMNHTCIEIKNSESRIKNFDSERCRYLKETYPLLNEYYGRLFSGKLGFKQVAEFSSYPSISLLGKKIVEFPDEKAEETWSVFDHPVIRIYRRI